jgi:hypothetical protein
MIDRIPSVDEVRAALEPLTLRQLERLSELSGVPTPTIYKVKLGETTNPGIETVRKFAPHISSVRVPDPAWPHPEGRPAIDVAAPAQPMEDSRAAA